MSRAAGSWQVAVSAGLLAVLWYGFRLHERCLLQGLDGNAWRIGFEVQREFRTPFSQLVSDPLQGMFDAYFPAFPEYLAPYLLWRIAGIHDLGKALVYFTYAAIAMGATYALGRTVGLGRWPALLAGLLLPAAVMPLFSAPILYPIMALNPHLLYAVALSTLIVACFWTMKGRSTPGSLMLALAAVGLTLLVSLGTVSLTALLAPAIAVYGGASLLDEVAWPGRVRKLLLAATLVLVPLALGVLHYLYALTRYTAFSQFHEEFVQHRTSLVFASVVWNSAAWGVALVVGGLLGAALALRTGPARLRLFAKTHLVATVVFQATAWAVVKWGHGYHGPSPLYFEIATWPFSLFFVAYLLNAPLEALVRTPGRRRAVGVLPVLAIGLTVAAGSRAGDRSCSQQHSFEPREPNAIVGRLIEEVRLTPGVPFRGFVATFVGDRPGVASTWLTHHAADAVLWNKIGNDLRTVGLWQFRIPALIQYNTYITPVYYRFVSSLLARPMDRQMRSALVFSLPRESILKTLGVRFLITDRDLGFGRVVAELSISGEETVRLIELPDTNLADFSPTRTIFARTAQEALEALARRGFDGRAEVVLDEPLDGALVPAIRSRMYVVKDGLKVSAESAGRSLIVLPVQYSRCWELESSAPGARLLRVNLMQMGILFDGKLEAELRLRFGPFWASACRFEDIRDADRLRLREAKGPALQ
jgi:hypothetical protein